MGIVLGWAEMLEAHIDDDGAEYLEKVLASGEHVIELTEIVRDYVETVVSNGDLTVEPVSIQSVFETEFSLRKESFPEAEFVCNDPLARRRSSGQ